jgi:hypothetical protein
MPFGRNEYYHQWRLLHADLVALSDADFLVEYHSVAPPKDDDDIGIMIWENFVDEWARRG